MISVLNCITQEHDLRLLSLSALICLLGCFTTTMLVARGQHVKAKQSIRWMMIAGFVLGCSVWSLHFVAMLAYMPDVPIAFDASLTFLSIVVAAGGAAASLVMWRTFDLSSRFVIGGVGVGLSVTAMHYLGVAAMRFSGFSFFDQSFVAASIFVSLLFGVIALFRADDLSGIARRIEVTAWLTIAICGLHFTGMTGLTIIPTSATEIVGGVDPVSLALIVSVVSVAILTSCLVAIILEKHLSQRTLKELARMRLMSDLSQEALLVHRDGVILEINSVGGRLFGCPSSEIRGKQLLDLFSADSLPGLLRRDKCAPDDRLPEEFTVEDKSGRKIVVEFSCRPIDFLGKPATAVALRDLSARKRNEARIRHLAHHDPLTGVLNRHALNDRLKHALDLATEQGTEIAVLYLDLDRFKSVNDLFGHAAGDEVLRQSIERLEATLSSADTLARVGGDEFVIVISRAISPEQTSAIASEMISSLQRPFAIEGKNVEIGVSIGLAFYPLDGTDVGSLLHAADTAMYQAKESRQGSFCFYEPSMNERLQTRRELEQELGRAISTQQLELFYQPIVNGRTGEVETYEALIRWRHPVRGMISPADFIPLAEQSGLMAQIGEWVIDTACHAASQWSAPWRVSVNVSPSQFKRSDIPAVVAAALKRYRLPPARLVVEITEAVFIADTTQAVETLSKLRALGIRLALDDFGTGYSSLSYLQLFKFDKFKIDQSFVRRLEGGAEALTIIQTIITLGHNLGLQVTVEGVETPEQALVLQGLGCDQMQGYYFGRPAPLTAKGSPVAASTQAAA